MHLRCLAGLGAVAPTSRECAANGVPEQGSREAISAARLTCGVTASGIRHHASGGPITEMAPGEIHPGPARVQPRR